ncbi:MAG: rhomboid family intramembrane serine protease [Bdellovibrionales bacterium]|nr:rhomboid family intramembrane serine protease [Bdellovibrionales bacterium]
MSSYRGPSVGSFQPRLTPAVKVLLILFVVVFVVQMSLRQFAGIAIEPWLGYSPADLKHGYVWEFFTYPFLHGSLTHLFFNAVVLYMLGSELEARWGTKKFLRYYAVCALGGAILQTVAWLGSYVVAPAYTDSLGNTPVIGASGALYGLFMAFGYLFGDALVLVFFILPMKARQFVAILFFIEVVSAVFYSGPAAGGGVAHLVHIGGLIAGFFYLRLKGGNLDGRGGGGLFRKKMRPDEVRRRLSLVVNNDNPSSSAKDGGKYPITWN